VAAFLNISRQHLRDLRR